AAEAEAAAKADAEAAAAAEADAQAKADAEAAAAAEADAQAKADAEAAAAAEAEAAAKAATEATPETAPAANPEAEAALAAAEAEAEAEARAKAEAELGLKPDGSIQDPTAGLKTAEEVIDPNATPVEAPVVAEEAMEALSTLLTAAQSDDPAAAEAAQPLAAAETATAAPDAAPSADAVATTTETVTEDSTRRATEEFAAAPQVVAPGKKNKLSDLEKAGLIGLGALVVGAIISQNNRAAQTDTAQGNVQGTLPQQQQVVSNTGDRVVVLKPDGSYQVYKDDDALLRRPGNTLRTETFKDGSTRTIVERADGSQVVTIRNATGRVLRRAHYDAQGQERVLINDLQPEQAITVSALPKPRSRPVVIAARDQDAALKAALAARQIEQLGRTFSLRQVRDIPQVRRLAAVIGVDSITFASGSSALSTSEVNALSDLGTTMQQLLDTNPDEIFLVEGHTDATGKAAMNLALSDRRAETVALALTEYFGIPPENMVVQGYGEDELLIDTQADEKRNRRVAVRIITPLL
ncbi:OmpA family protein, partial [Pseudorhodobacter sp. E13]|uniref:OmpA family protein n=1 Tax=Pseudorhodobacter sp. E13 TaxID=2487931 RepID=UPI000FB5AE3A